MDRRKIIVGGGAVLVGLGVYAVFGPSKGPATTLRAASAEPAGGPLSDVPDMVLGDPNAPVTFVEYASFTCPHCAAFHTGPFKQLKADFIDTGKIRFVHREVFFDRYGLWAAIVARCGEGAENRYFGVADLIYERQRQWAARSNSPAEVAQELRKIGKLAGLTDAQLDGCFANEDNAKALVAYYEANATADEISATPSFVINGQKYSNMAYDRLKQTVEGKLPS